MNSLEFIDRKIKQLEERKEKAFKNEYYSIYKECSQKITALHQIKAELEAWYVVKEDIDYQETEYCSERPEFTYKYKKWSFKLTEDEPNFEEKSEKLKKALEVEENDR